MLARAALGSFVGKLFAPIFEASCSHVRATHTISLPMAPEIFLECPRLSRREDELVPRFGHGDGDAELGWI